MRTLAAWIGQLGFLVFFAGLVQILLPDNDLRKVARLSIGLVLILAVVEPVVGWLDGSGGMAWIERAVGSIGTAPSGEPYVRRGQELAATAWSRVQEDWRIQAERELATFVSLVPGVKDARVTIVAGEDRIKEVEVRLAPASSDADLEELAAVEGHVRRLVGGLLLGDSASQTRIVWEQ